MAQVLLTSGPTREYLDPVRYLSNASSGRMGAALAAALLRVGHEVTIVSGPVAVDYPSGAKVVSVESTLEMLSACLGVVSECDGIVAVAAPCDFRPREMSSEKIKKSLDQSGLVLELIKTPDILTQLKAARPSAWCVGFALETEAGIENAVHKRRQKGCDLIVLNQPDTLGSANAAVRLIDASDRCVAEHVGNKAEVADVIVEWIQTHLTGRSGS